jgi:hypothetical protein
MFYRSHEMLNVATMLAHLETKCHEYKHYNFYTKKWCALLGLLMEGLKILFSKDQRTNVVNKKT